MNGMPRPIEKKMKFQVVIIKNYGGMLYTIGASFNWVVYLAVKFTNLICWITVLQPTIFEPMTNWALYNWLKKWDIPMVKLQVCVQPLPEPTIFPVNSWTTHQDTRRFITNKGQSITLIATLLYSKQRQKNLVTLWVVYPYWKHVPCCKVWNWALTSYFSPIIC